MNASGSGSRVRISPVLHPTLCRMIRGLVYAASDQELVAQRRSDVHIQGLGARLGQAAADHNSDLRNPRTTEECGRLDQGASGQESLSKLVGIHDAGERRVLYCSFGCTHSNVHPPHPRCVCFIHPETMIRFGGSRDWLFVQPPPEITMVMGQYRIKPEN